MSSSFQIGDMVKHTNSIEVYGFISNITLFRDKTLYSVFWFEFPQYGEAGEYEAHHLTKVA